MKAFVYVAVVAMAAATLEGCFLWPQHHYVIPEMQTAREQYALAYGSFRNASNYFGKSKKKDQAVEEAKAAFSAVITNFPKDDKYRPMAELMLGRCELIRENYNAAADYYRQALDKNPNDTELQEVGLYEMGLALDGAKKYAEAKDAYRKYIDKYSNDPKLKDNPDAKKRLAEAERRYRIIRSE